MREKLQSFTLTQLKEIAKSAGLKGIASLKKEELIDRLVELDEKMKADKAAEEKKAESKKSEEKKPAEKKASSNKPSGKKNTSGKNAKGKEAPAEEKPQSEKAPKQENKTESKSAPEAKSAQESKPAAEAKPAQEPAKKENVYTPQEGDEPANGILEVMPEGYGFIRCDNYLPGENDVYVSPAQIRKFGLRTGDVLDGVKKAKSPTEKFSPLIFLNEVNGYPLSEAMKRVAFENMTPIFPNSRIRMETDDEKNIAMRVMDLVSPVGKGQRGMIVSPPKAGKTTLLKSVAQSILYHNPDMHIIILLIDERPEEVTDMKEAIKGKHVEVIYSTFDEMPEHHARVSEMVIERARRLVEHGEDVVILLDSITRLARAYNQVIPPS